MPFKSVGIVTKPRKTEIRDIVPPLVEWLRDRGLEVFIDRETAASLQSQEKSLTRNEMPSRVDLFVVLGGDGTLLATARALNRRPVPILAVNVGGLGFLANVTLDELYPTLESVLADQYQVDRRVQIEAEIIRAGEVIASFLALNDVVVNKGAVARILDFELVVNGMAISTYRADGLIVSTPTGSTAYSLAAGGPIIAPTVQAFIVTPICAHTLTLRPLVLPDTATIEVVVKSQRESSYVTVDGQVGLGARSEDVVRMRKSDSCVELILSPYRHYFDTLRTKLKWGER